MSDVGLHNAIAALRGPVSIRGERRGFAKRRGVPDSVFWVKPADDRIHCHPIPILIELEASFNGARADFRKFAKRHNDPKYQYTLEFPILGINSRDRIFRGVRYEVIGIRTNMLSDKNEISEQEMHRGLEAWFDRFTSSFDVELNVRDYLNPPIIEWELEFTMFGHDFSTEVPFIVGDGSDITKDVLRRLSPPTIPGIVVVNGKTDSRVDITYSHRTAIEFPTIHPIRFRDIEPISPP